MVAFFLLLNIVLMVVKYPQGGKTVKAVADRAGHLSMVNMPIFFMLFGRNNILIFVTGWQYRDFQVFHKWIARISSLEMIIHGAGYGYMSALRGRSTIARVRGFLSRNFFTDKRKAKKSPQKVNYGSAYENAWWNGVAVSFRDSHIMLDKETLADQRLLVGYWGVGRIGSLLSVSYSKESV